MRIAEYKKVNERIELIPHEAVYDDDGAMASEAYIEERHIPIMGMVYRDATPEEEAEAAAEAERIAEEERNREPTAEERLAMVEDAFAELCEVIFNG